jgi:predicted ATP-dependent endonuclease of OLD family
MIFDFANWGINNSIVLIDELELHLHPPLQQGLLNALRSLGRDNQFIITTHSDAVEAIVPPECIRRL